MCAPLYISHYMGKAFFENIASGHIVGSDNDEKKEGASDDTSCGVEDKAKGKEKDC